jgi:hypothetical protein
VGPIISNGQTLNDQTGVFKYGGASVGDELLSGGSFGAVGTNSCGSTIWDASVGWTPNIGVPVSVHGGVSYTWAFPSWGP